MENQIEIGDCVVVSDKVQFLKNMRGVVIQPDSFDTESLMVELKNVNKMQSIKKAELIRTNEIDVDRTELREANYTEFMAVLDVEILRQYPESFDLNFKYSETLTKEEWLSETGATVQDVIDAEVECWEGDEWND